MMLFMGHKLEHSRRAPTGSKKHLIARTLRLYRRIARDWLDEDSTGTPRNIHEQSWERPYSGVVMKGAFVVQLKNAGRGVTRGMEGSVEEVDTGKESHFRSEEELVSFLRECFARSCQMASQDEGTQ
jgi:hypothetical protein